MKFGAGGRLLICVGEIFYDMTRIFQGTPWNGEGTEKMINDKKQIHTWLNNKFDNLW